MFTKGQMIFAAVFAFAFIVAMVWSYRKDLKLHKVYYKNVAMKAAIGIILTLAFFFLIRFYYHQ